VDSPIVNWYDGRFRFYSAASDKDVAMRRQKFSGIIIANLGNTNGQKPELENTLPYIQKALKEGWHVCVDVIFHSGAFILPRDGGFHVAPPALLSKQRVWCRAHDPNTVDALCNVGAHCFLNSENFMSLTSAQFIWTLPPHELVARSIAMLPETAPPDWLDNAEPAGLCSNEPVRYI
jgi:hypothetical protein